MARPIVAFDAGSSSLKMAVFSAERNRLQLIDFDVSPISIPAEASLEERNRILARQMKASLSLKKVKSGKILVAMSGQTVFTRFVKLPAVEEAKISQIIRYEAQQQVPFPIEDVEWDHNIIGKTPAGEIDIVLVAVKNDIIMSFTQECRKAGLEVNVVDAAPLCVYNCLRHAEQEFAECTAVIDFGARAANLIISEGDELWARTIPIGGDNITAAIAKELNIDEAKAERVKQTAWVPGTSAGEPQDATEEQRRASNVVRSFVERMFAELSRSIGFYRSQPGHSAIRRILLSGGSSRLKNFKDSLSDKFKVDVGWLSPLNRIGVASSVDREELNRCSDLLAGVVGLGLRGAELAKIGINLLPKSFAVQRELSRKKVLLVASGWLLVASFLFMAFGQKIAHGDNSGAFNNLLRTIGKVVPGIMPGGRALLEEKQELEGILQRDDAKFGEIKKIQDEIQDVEKKVDEIAEIQGARLYWAEFIEELKKTKTEAAGRGQRNYIWLTGVLITTSRTTAVDFAPDIGAADGDMFLFQPRRRTGRPAALVARTASKKTSASDPRPWVIITGYVKIPPEVSGQDSAQFFAKGVEAFKNALEGMGETFLCTKEHRYREDKESGILYPVSPDTGPAKAYRYRWDEAASQVVLEGLMEGGGAEAASDSASGEAWKVLATQKSRKKLDWIDESGIKGAQIPCPIELARSQESRARVPNATRTGGYLDDVTPRGFEEPLPGERVGRFTIEARLGQEFFYAKKSQML